MTFDDVYIKFFSILFKYSYYRLGKNHFLAEEATAKAFRVLYAKWDKLSSHDERYLKAWLIGTLQNTMHETLREQPPNHESLDDPVCLEQVERQQLQMGLAKDSFEEDLRFYDYVAEIEAKLGSQQDRLLFHARVVDGASYSDLSASLRISENAVKIRWMRLKQKLKPILAELFNCK